MGQERPFALRKNSSALRFSLRAWVVLIWLLVLSRLVGGDFDADATDLRKTMRAAARVVTEGSAPLVQRARTVPSKLPPAKNLGRPGISDASNGT
jgi:hypothetical protein